MAVCADANPWFPATHPTRRAWLALARELGDDLLDDRGAPPPVDLYVNGALLGLTRERAGFLDNWERYLVAMAVRGPGLAQGPGSPGYDCSFRSSPFLLPDQDALNLTVMAHAGAVSMLGPQGMGLGPGWSVVSRPVAVHGPVRHALRRADVRAALLIATLVGRR